MTTKTNLCSLDNHNTCKRYFSWVGKLWSHVVILISLLTFFLLPSSGIQCQSLFETAVNLNTHYDSLENNPKYAHPFINEVQQFYRFPIKDINEIHLKYYINSFLHDYVKEALEKAKTLDKDMKNFLINEAIILADSTSKYYLNRRFKTKCPYKKEIEDLKEKREKEYVKKLIIKVDEALQEKVIEGGKKVDRDRIKSANYNLLQNLIDIDNKLFQIDNKEKKFIREQEGVNAGLATYKNNRNREPISGMSEASRPIASPIILQQHGSTSLSTSNIIDGTAKWIVERMTDELTMLFFGRFEKWIVNEKNINKLFPNTYDVLQFSLATDYKLMIQILKAAFQKDLKSLTFNLPDYLESDKIQKKEYQVYEDSILNTSYELHKIKESYNSLYNSLDKEYEALTKFQEEKIKEASNNNSFDWKAFDDKEQKLLNNYDEKLNSLDTIYNQFNKKSKDLTNIEEKVLKENIKLKYVSFTSKTLKLLSEGMHISNVLSYLNENIDTQFPRSGNLKPVLLVMDMISRSLVSENKNKNTVWVDNEELKKLKDPDFKKIYYGLLYEIIMHSLEEDENKLEVDLEELKKKNSPEQNKNISDAIKWKLYDLKYFVGITLEYSLFEDIDINTSTDTLCDEVLSNFKEYLDNKDDKMVEMIKNPLTSFYNEIKNDSVLTNNIAEYNKDEEFRYWDSLDTLQSTISQIFTNDSTLKSNPNQLFNELEYAIDDNDPEWAPSSDNDKSLSERIFPKIDSLLDVYIEENKEAKDSIHKAAHKTAEIAIKLFEKKDRIFPQIDSIQRQVKINYLNEQFEKDSLEIVQIYQQETPNNTNDNDIKIDSSIAMINLKLNRLVNHKTFIDTIFFHKNFIGEIVDKFGQIANQIDFVHSEHKELQFKGVSDHSTRRSIYLLKTSLEPIHLIYDKSLADNGNSKIIKEFTDKLLDAYTDVLKENYNGVVMNLIPVADSLSNMNPSKEVAEHKRVQKLYEIFKYAAFIAAVAESRNSTDIKNAIRAIALPPGSYSIKRRSVRNISFNVYPGLTGGMELLVNNDIRDWAPNIGPTAPLGFAFSWGYKRRIDSIKYNTIKEYRLKVNNGIVDDDNYLTGHSGSLFFPLIDLGAIVLFRLGDSERSLPQDIGLQQIFSPGIIYAHGLPKLPISIMAGVQFSPLLRTISDELEMEKQKFNSIRFNIGLVMDLPMANFHTERN